MIGLSLLYIAFSVAQQPEGDADSYNVVAEVYLLSEASQEALPEEVVRNLKVLDAESSQNYGIESFESREFPADGTEQDFALGAEYRLQLAVLRDCQESAETVLRVYERASGLIAVRGTGVLSREQGALIRGLTLDGAPASVFMRLLWPSEDPEMKQPSNEPGDDFPDERPGEDFPGDDQGEEQQQQEPQPQDGQRPQPREGGNQDQQQDGDQQMTQDRPTQSEKQPQDRQSIEALLESLEQIDKQEKAESNKRQVLVPLRGDWW